MKLLGSPGSPYVRKVRIVLAEKRVDYEYVIGRPSAADSRIHEYNPLGKVPTLVMDDGRALYDSVVIVEYLDGLGSGPRLIPEAAAERLEVKRWEALGDGIADATVAVSHDLREHEAQRKPAAWYVKQRQKIQRGLATMERDLGRNEFCYGGKFSLADIAAGFALGYLDQVLQDTDWRSEFPGLKSLAARLAQRESFIATKPAV